MVTIEREELSFTVKVGKYFTRHLPTLVLVACIALFYISTLELSNSYKTVAVALLLILCVFVDELLFKPVEYSKSLRESPHAPKNIHKRIKNAGPVPPPFPNGWFFVSRSADLKKGQVKQISVLGAEYAIFRGEDNNPRVLSAFCPHLGANLAINGVVKKNCLMCPFHGWEFDGETGNCQRIPYSNSIPSNSSVASIPVVEKNDVIYMWFHSNGQLPSWEVPQAEGLGTSKYRCDGYSQHQISCHIQEIPENGADNAHLQVLHDWPVVEFLGYFGFRHGWSATWEALQGSQKHVARVNLNTCFQFFGKTIPLTKLKVNILQIGPGIVILKFIAPIGSAYIVQSVTPLEPLLQHVVHSVYMPWYVPRIIGKGLLWGLAVQVERDVPIWNNKTYLAKPVLCKGDGRIASFRRWFRQFYDENSASQPVDKEDLSW